MSTTQKKNRINQVWLSRRFERLEGDTAGPLVTKELRRLCSELSKDRTILKMPAPTGLVAEGKTGAILLTWDRPVEKYRQHIDGARIWRAPQASDSDTYWKLNDAKAIICDTTQSNSYSDPQTTTDTFIYWVQWVNSNGEAGNLAGGVTGAAAS